ncbi:MAG: MBL fold metallo-hydrolase [Deltaproteobacteria bacterium]|jgi:alkyl sulfatase BDS1-like metallo-beta-lactamase superfamily hydrolase|nr:MBL fold metallo-hydrolase [Deltaproteobacteria bacterium]MBW2530633.1 MBL fold metallo-hydrolase [Deltaproteobacteria bacterium]
MGKRSRSSFARRRVALVALGAALGAVLGYGGATFQLTRPAAVTREPERPGAARLEYEPPPRTRVPLGLAADAVRKVRDLTTPEVLELTEQIHLAKGFALSNVGIVVTSEGVVLVDTTESPETGVAVAEALRELTEQPVHTIVYTHYHPDHPQGTAAFAQPGLRIIATDDFVELTRHQNELLGAFHLRARANQSGAAAPAHSFALPVERNPFGAFGRKIAVVMPTVTFADRYDFELGGKRFELFHTSGETPDHLAMWLPDDRALFVGDLYYASFPNLSTPMLEPRPVQGWIRSLSRFIELEPELLIPSHTRPIRGAEAVREVLTGYRAAIQHVLDETVRCIEEGKTVDQAVAEIALPERLRNLPYLEEGYGRVSWSVRGIYRGFTGWYDGHGTGLDPLPPRHRARELVTLAGGADSVLARAIELQRAGEHQLCAELCDAVIDANGQDRLAHRIKAESLRALAFAGNNLNAFGFYRSAYALEMAAAE